MKNIFKLILVIITAFVIVSAVKAVYKLVMHAMYPVRYYEYIDKYASEYDLDEYLVMGVIKAESNYIHDAHSGVAHGLMQLTPETALWISDELKTDFSETDIEDPETNIRMGCFYLSYLISHYNNNVDVALAAYNAGMGNVSKWLSNSEYSKDGVNLSYIPFKETREYIKKVNEYKQTYKKLYEFDETAKNKLHAPL